MGVIWFLGYVIVALLTCGVIQHKKEKDNNHYNYASYIMSSMLILSFIYHHYGYGTSIAVNEWESATKIVAYLVCGTILCFLVPCQALLCINLNTDEITDKDKEDIYAVLCILNFMLISLLSMMINGIKVSFIGLWVAIVMGSVMPLVFKVISVIIKGIYNIGCSLYRIGYSLNNINGKEKKRSITRYGRGTLKFNPTPELKPALEPIVLAVNEKDKDQGATETNFWSEFDRVKDLKESISSKDGISKELRDKVNDIVTLLDMIKEIRALDSKDGKEKYNWALLDDYYMKTLCNLMGTLIRFNRIGLNDNFRESVQDTLNMLEFGIKKELGAAYNQEAENIRAESKALKCVVGV